MMEGVIEGDVADVADGLKDDSSIGVIEGSLDGAREGGVEDVVEKHVRQWLRKL